MATLEQIQARLKKLQAQAEAIVAKQSSAVLEKIRGLMEKHGLTTADIDAHVGSKRRGPKAGVKAAAKTAQSLAKYQDPKSGATWSGHGRAPAWIANVKDRSKFLLDSNGTSAVLAPTKKAKTKAATNAAGNYARGPQPAKYRDPKSGATWSGRGRAPEWLASVKDRTPFLIEGVGAAAPEPTSANKANKPKSADKGGAALEKGAAKRTAATSTKKASVPSVANPSAKIAATAKALSKKAAAVKTAAAKADATAVPNVPAEARA